MTQVGRVGRRFDHILVMGVSGSGKTSVSQAIAARLGGVFVEADDYHPQSNVALMSSGRPLTDAHRWPWLEAVSGAAADALAMSRGPVVVACSALKRAYRDHLRSVLGPLTIVHLDGPADLIGRRLESRHGHFMSASLLPSQFATLEALGEDETGVVVSTDEPVERIVDRVVAWLAEGRAA
ncbi:gluconokinase [Shinella zoogloeoides]|uniref:gluconokinase n=1 Tax=Shinella zoogloeoides TaxID=352475 RepID=UPI001F57238F|nr:gluconokinase [Shinella zoogloeoides]